MIFGEILPWKLFFTDDEIMEIERKCTDEYISKID
jgi:hypothetical protein